MRLLVGRAAHPVGKLDTPTWRMIGSGARPRSKICAEPEALLWGALVFRIEAGCCLIHRKAT